MATPSFNGLRVLVLESRRGRELGLIVTSYGGEPFIAPSMREVPIESNAEAVRFIDDLIAGDFDVVVLLTGVGARALLDIVQRVQGTRKRMIEALRETVVVARGPKPLAVMREIDVPVFLTAPEPNTWRELVAALDARKSELSLDGLSVAVQEYGASNPQLLAALESRGARVTAVPVYQWALPEDTGPLRTAARAVADGALDVALFTSATQAVHLMKIGEELGIANQVLAGLRRMIIASIGPTTSEELRQRGLQADLESSHPKMGFLAREAAEQAPGLLKQKRGPGDRGVRLQPDQD